MTMASFWLEMEPPEAERVAVRSRHRSLVSSLKERVIRRNLISQSMRPGVDILSHFLNIQHRKVACATQVLFPSDAQLRSCHKCFSHYRQPASLNQSVLIVERCEAATAKALVYLDLVHPTYGPPHATMQEFCNDRYATVLLRSWVGHYQHARGVSLIM